MHTDSTQPTRSLADDSIAFLRQGIELLRVLSDDQYNASMPPVYASSVGAHIRHILDHFNCLLDGVEDGNVDYDGRERNPLIETQRVAAIEALQTAVGRIRTLSDQPCDLALRVKMDCGGPQDADIWSLSSLARELQFLTSHTIHHYALVAAILDHAGYRVPTGFGISPSTLNYERLRQAQAR